MAVALHFESVLSLLKCKFEEYLGNTLEIIEASAGAVKKNTGL